MLENYEYRVFANLRFEISHFNSHLKLYSSIKQYYTNHSSNAQILRIHTVSFYVMEITICTNASL